MVNDVVDILRSKDFDYSTSGQRQPWVGHESYRCCSPLGHGLYVPYVSYESYVFEGFKCLGLFGFWRRMSKRRFEVRYWDRTCDGYMARNSLRSMKSRMESKMFFW